MPDIGPVITVTYAQRIALNAAQLVPNQFYFQTDTVGVGDGTTSLSGYYQVTGGNPNGWAYRDTYLPVQLLQTNGKVMSGYIFTNELDVALNPPSASAANSYGVRASIFTNPGLLANITGAINAGLLMAQHFAASTVSALNAVYANVTNFGNGTVLNGQALVAEVIQGGSGTISAIQGIVAQMFKTGSGAISYATGLVLYGWNNATNYVNILLGTNLQPNGAWNIYSVVTDPSVLGQANIIFGNTTSTLATTATVGFPHIPTCAGQPTGVPTLYTGVVPMVFDTTNNKLWIYTSGVWKGVVVA